MFPYACMEIAIWIFISIHVFSFSIHKHYKLDPMRCQHCVQIGKHIHIRRCIGHERWIINDAISVCFFIRVSSRLSGTIFGQKLKTCLYPKCKLLIAAYGKYKQCVNRNMKVNVDTHFSVLMCLSHFVMQSTCIFATFQD